MTIFESKALVDKTVNEVYLFLEDLNNHESLMPQNISNWSSTKDEASFSIQNMGNLALKISNRVENQEVSLVPASAAPITLNIKWLLENKGGQTEATLTISADLNMMMKMLASGPLQKLTDYQTSALKSKF